MDEHDVGDPHPSGMRLKPGVAIGRTADVLFAIDRVEVLVLRTREDTRLARTLRSVQQALLDAEARLPEENREKVDAVLDSTAGWAVAVARAIASALAYRAPQQRRTAMELASEESAMRLLMSVEPARIDAKTSAMDPDLREALSQLEARVEVVDRMLHARMMTAAAR